jgi:hypothetical protein
VGFVIGSTHPTVLQAQSYRRRTIRGSAIPAVFAVLPGNYQRAAARLPRKSWVSDGSTIGKTANSVAVFRCFLLFLWHKSDILQFDH